jgi:nucleotide-binding universal stress UspA family protein
LCAGEITLVHVIEPPPYPEFGYAHIPSKEADRKRAANENLEAQCQKLARGGVKSSSVLRSGNAFHEIAEQAREQSTDLIVIATHGRGVIARALLGSTTERVVRHAPCPVLVVREREREFLLAWLEFRRLGFSQQRVNQEMACPCQFPASSHYRGTVE